MIDFGQVQQLNVDLIHNIAKLIVLLVEGTSEEVLEHYKAMGVRTRKMDPYVLEKLARIGFDRDDPDMCEGMNTQLFLEALAKRDEIIHIPEGYLMVVRVGLLLRGLGAWLQIPHSTAQKWLPKAKKFLEMYEKNPSTVPLTKQRL